MKVVPLIEHIKMSNGMEVIVHSTFVSSRQIFSRTEFLIHIEGAFKYKGNKDFQLRKFTVPVYKESVHSDIGCWLLDSEPGNTINFFDLSDSGRPSERAQFLLHCLSVRGCNAEYEA